MTGPRARAYTRVIRTLDDCGAAKLQTAELELVRTAADALLFCADLSADSEARDAVTDVLDLHDHLVATGRWTPQRAFELAEDIWACGPAFETVELEAAA